MSRRATWIVFRKELTDGLRDRRSLGAALLYALLGPVVVVLAMTALSRDAASEDGPLIVAVAGGERAAELTAFLQRAGATLAPAGDDVEAAVREGRLEAALSVPPDFAEDLAAWRGASVAVVSDPSRRASASAGSRLQRLVAAYGAQVASQRLLARGVSPDLASPVSVRPLEVGRRRPPADAALGMLLIFLVVSVFVAGMNVAIDVTAGERERGSLEPLALLPVPRAALATGKWLAASAFSVLGLMLSLLLSALVLRSERMQALGADFAPGPAEALAILAATVPLALLAASLQMLLATFARSYKEAQTYLSMLLLAPMMPGFLLEFSRMPSGGWTALVPVVGHNALLSDLMRAQASSPAAWAALGAATLAACAACVAGTASLLRREAIILGR